MLRKITKFLVVGSLVAVFVFSAGNIKNIADNNNQSLIQTMSHGIGGT